MARNSYDMDDNMKSSESETYDRQRIRAETARTVLKTAARIAQETVPGTLWIMAETARDKKMRL